MRKVVAVEWMTLDGVVQAPGHPDEDRSGGFKHGGWHLGYFDDLSREWVVQGYAEAGGFLLGHRTYENLAAYWPNASEEEQVIAEPLAWENSTVLKGDLAQAVAALKQQDGEDLHVIGSSQLVQTLLAHDLVDQFRVMIDPLVVGGGKRIFGDDGARRPLRLLEHKVTTTGAILATYAMDRD